MSFAKCINNIETVLSSDRSSGDPLIVGDAAGITLSGGEWIRVTIERKSDGVICILRCEDVTGSTLSSLTPIEGTADIAAVAGDYVEMRITAGALQDIHTALLYTTTTPTTTTVGGISSGTSFTDAPLLQVIDDLLHPYQSPAFTSFAITGAATQEVGATFSGSKTFTWSISNSGNIAANSIAIADTTNSATLATGLANDGSQTISISVTKSTPATNVWTITATNTNTASLSTTTSLQWMWRVYYGTSASTTLNEAGIEGLVSSLLTTTFARTYTHVSGGYKYISFPTSLGSPSSFKDALTLLNVAMCDSSDDSSYDQVANGIAFSLVSVTNTNGITTSYRVYRTKNILGGSIQIIVA